jgi:hypothetical protein
MIDGDWYRVLALREGSYEEVQVDEGKANEVKGGEDDAIDQEKGSMEGNGVEMAESSPPLELNTVMVVNENEHVLAL